MISESLTLQPGRPFAKPHQKQNSLYGGGKRCDMQQKPPASFCADPDQVGFGRGGGSISRMAFDGWGNGNNKRNTPIKPYDMTVWNPEYSRATKIKH